MNITPVKICVHLPITAGPLVSVWCTIKRRHQAAESRGNVIPLIKADATAEREGTGCTLSALLGRHLQKLPSCTGEGCQRHVDSKISEERVKYW